MKKAFIEKFIPPTALLAFSAFFSALLGVARDRLLATYFGATQGQGIFNLDVYYAAFKIPDIIYFIVVLGAATAGFIPIFTQHKVKNEMRKAWEFASVMLHIVLVLVLFLASLTFIFTPLLAKLVAAGFPPEDFNLVVRLMRIMCLSPIIFSATAIFMGIQDSFKTFFYRSLGPIFYNLGIIISIFLFAKKWGVYGVTWGVIFGALLQLFVQLPSLRLVEYKHVWSFDYKRPDIKKALLITVPRIVSGAMYQLSQLAYTLIASFLFTGSITILYFANNLYSLPLSIIGVSFSVTSFARFSELASEDSKKDLSLELKRVMQQVLFLVLPATAGVFLLREEIIGAILLGGEFTQKDALLTAGVLVILLASLFSNSLVLQLNRAYYALHDSKTPLMVSLLSVFVGVSSAYFLAIPLGFGVKGIAYAMSGSNLLLFAFLYLLLSRRLSHSLLSFWAIAKMLIATSLMTAFVFFVKTMVQFPESLLFKYLYLVLFGFLGAAFYFFLSKLFKLKELSYLFKRFN